MILLDIYCFFLLPSSLVFLCLAFFFFHSATRLFMSFLQGNIVGYSISICYHQFHNFSHSIKNAVLPIVSFSANNTSTFHVHFVYSVAHATGMQYQRPVLIGANNSSMSHVHLVYSVTHADVLYYSVHFQSMNE